MTCRLRWYGQNRNQYGGREFHGMSSQSNLPHCRVLPPSEFNCHDSRAMCHIAGCWHRANSTACHPRASITLQGAATLWIHCHDSRATCHIAGYSHLAKSMSWSCHIAGCNNSIHHIENRLSPYFIYFLVFNAVWALTSGGFRIVSDTLVIIHEYANEWLAQSTMMTGWQQWGYK